MDNTMLFYIAILAGLLGTSISQDPCTSYSELSEDERLQDVTATNPTNEICDRYLLYYPNEWFRFTTGSGMLPESCVHSGFCSTNAPIYLNGQHPTGDEEVTASVCNNYLDEPDCCDWSTDIRIKRCTENGATYFVYRLQSVPYCNSAYCVMGVNNCTDGSLWDATINECVSYPVLTNHPELHGPYLPASFEHPDGFKFRCRIYSTDTSDDARFRVKLYFVGGTELDEFDEDNIETSEEIEITSSDDYAEFTENYLFGHMGKNVGCVVRSYRQGSSIYSPYVYSNNTYWIGIRGPTDVQVEEDDGPVEIELVSTVPITCATCDIAGGFENRCFYTFNVVTRTPGGPPHVCDFDIRFEPNSVTASAALQITNVAEPELNHVITQNIVFMPLSVALPPGSECIWQNYTPENINVRLVDDAPYGLCKSTGDPHITTFDDRYYHLYKLNAYRFIELSSTASRIFQVHIQTRPCNGVACNCAIAVREANTVVIVDVCGNRLFTARFQLDNSDPVIDTVWENNHVWIKTVAGVKIKADIFHRAWGKYMNIYAYLPSTDQGETEGLCGNFNGDSGDDTPEGSGSEPTGFTNSERLDPDESLFHGVISWCDIELVDANPCRCSANGATSIECGIGLGQYVRTANSVCNGFDRKKRDTYEFDVYGEDAYESEYDANDIVDTEITWPTQNGYTLEQVNETCWAILTSFSVYQQCSDIYDPARYIQSCIEDTRLFDDLDAGYSLLTDVEETCIFTIESMPPDQAEEMETILVEIRSNVCPGQCSRRGSCVNSTCICDEGYIGASCNIDGTIAPNITSFAPRSRCNIQEQNCTSVIVRAETLTNLLDLTCSISLVELQENGDHIISQESVEVDSTFINFEMMECTLPESPVSENYEGDRLTEFGYMISISNDGVLLSEPKLFVIYDSTCRNCTSDGICVNANGACAYEGMCTTGGRCDEDVCDNYYELDQPERSTGRVTVPEEGVLCDNYRIESGQWYRFTGYTGGVIPDYCVDSYHCDTYHPIWYDGDHPSEFNPYTEGLACSRMGAEDCCHWNDTLAVRYCNDANGEEYFVYKLNPPPACPAAYCSGSITPCASNEAWDSEQSQCIIVEWSTWGVWTECSSSCGDGISWRQRYCSVDGACDGVSMEQVVCSLTECAVEEESEGAIMTIPEDDVVSVISSNTFVQLVTDAVETFCITSPNECCDSLGYSDVAVNTGTNLDQAFICAVSIEEIADSTARLLITVSFVTADLNEYCGSTNNEAGLETDMPSNLVLDVIESNEESLEEVMGIAIEDIEPASPVQDDGSDESLEKKSNSDNIFIIIGAVLGVVALVAIVTLIVVVFMNQIKPKRAVSFASVDKLEPATPRATTPVQIGHPILDNDDPLPQIQKAPEATAIDWEKLRPKTGYKKPGTLTPL